MLHKGKIRSWNDDRGFGFVSPNNGGDDVFIHIKAFSVRNVRPEAGDIVVFSIIKDDNGRFRAVNAKFVNEKEPRRMKRGPSVTAIAIALSFYAAIGFYARQSELHRIVLIAYAVLGFITFIAYASDKSAAQAGHWRIKENTLHLLSLMGGWPGALIAQQTLRHKSKKASFQIVFWFIVVLNCAGLVWLHTEEGLVYLRQLIELTNRMPGDAIGIS